MPSHRHAVLVGKQPITGRQLAGILGGSYGFAPHGGPNIPVVAAGMECSRSTVYRWLNHQSDLPAEIPADRLGALIAAHRPQARHYRQEALEVERARLALDVLTSPRRKRARQWATETRLWREQGWLEPHVVAIVHHEHLGLSGLVSPRDDVKLLTKAASGGAVTRKRVVANHFLARLMVQDALKQVDEWRFVPTSMPRGQLRRSWMWIDGANPRLRPPR